MKGWFIALVLSWAIVVQAQERFTATVDRTTVQEGEYLTLTLSLEGFTATMPAPSLPALENLQVVGGPFTSQNFTLINGRASASYSYSYQLRAMAAGKGRIGESRVKVRGREYVTDPIVITILPASGQSSGRRGGTGTSADVFIRAIPDRTEAYVGEQVTVTYKLYFAVQLTNPELVRQPKAAGFWVEEIALPQHAPLTDEVVGGRAYRVAVIRKLALFATREGELEVEPLVVSTDIIRQPRSRMLDPFDIFNDPFFQLGRQKQTVQVESPPVRLRIKPLPQAGVPASFRGAVGAFKIRAALDKMSCRTSEALTLVVEIEGTGNVKTLPPPVVSFPPDLQSFDPEVSEDVRRGSRISGVKTFKYVLIPRAPGLQVIPGPVFSFFNPERGRYEEVSAPELRVMVEKGEGSAVSVGIPVATKRGVENISTDIAFAKTRAGRFVSDVGLPHRGAGFWIWTGVPWVALAVVLVMSGRRERQGAARQLYRRQLQQAWRELKMADKALRGGNHNAMVEHVAAAVEHVASALTNKPTGLTVTELEDAWREQGLDDTLREEILALRAECDMLRFAGGMRRADNSAALLKRARDLAIKASRTKMPEPVP